MRDSDVNKRETRNTELGSSVLEYALILTFLGGVFALAGELFYQVGLDRGQFATVTTDPGYAGHAIDTGIVCHLEDGLGQVSIDECF